MSEPIVLTRSFSEVSLAKQAAEGSAPEGWYLPRPRTAEEWRKHVEGVREGFARGDWYAKLAPAFEVSGVAADRLRRVVNEGGVLITTGQQPGLFGGPLYTWSKAVSAIAIADVVEQTTGIPTAPVFWAATYDADFAEASASYVALGNLVERLQMDSPAQLGHSMRDTPLGDVGPLLKGLERALGAGADPAIFELVRACYGPRETVGSAFIKLARAILEPLGMAVLDAGHPAVREAEQSLMRRALTDAERVDAALREREEALRSHGDAPVVPHVRGLSLVFETAGGERTRIPISAAGAAGADARGDLEPNVLLRPVTERAILPTAAYVAGPSEIVYFAQASAVAAALGATVPLVLPRWTGMIIEPHIQRILTRYTLAVDDLRDPHAVLTRLTRERIPDAVRVAMAKYRSALEAADEELTRALANTEPPLIPDAVVAGLRNNITHRLDRFERRVLAATKRRHDTLVRDIETARAALFPFGKPQERLLNLMPLLARHGTPLLRAMLEQARAHASALVSAPVAQPSRPLHVPAGDRR